MTTRDGQDQRDESSQNNSCWMQCLNCNDQEQVGNHHVDGNGDLGGVVSCERILWWWLVVQQLSVRREKRMAAREYGRTLEDDDHRTSR